LQDEFGKSFEAEGQAMPTPLEFLLINCYHNPEIKNIAKSGFKFFIHEDVEFDVEEKRIVIMDKSVNSDGETLTRKNRYLTEENYFDF
jgi:hypoxanthine-guanine phosphoribosyltransferase